MTSAADTPIHVGSELQPDEAPRDLCVGCINPRALVEAVMGRKVNWNDKSSLQLMSDTLQKQYDELFDIKFGSPLYTGLKLGPDNKVVRAKPEELKILADQDLATPDLSVLKKLHDLNGVGVDDLSAVPVTQAWLTNGKLNVQLNVPTLNKTISNLSLTKTFFDILVGGSAPSGSAPSEWTPANATWKDVGDFERQVTEFNDPIQGAVGDCWLIAALSAVAWALPFTIVHRPRRTSLNDSDHVDQLTFYSKGGSHDAATGTVEVTEQILVGNVGGNVLYCRSADLGELWPAIYEKAFAKWSTGNGTDKPNILALAAGDPAKATAQLTNRTPLYYDCSAKTASQLWGLVRANSLSRKTFNPMTAWTYGSGTFYTNSGIAANHAYTVLGWTFDGNKEYIILRNPWGYFEPTGTNTLQGVIHVFDSSFWRPINMIGNDGVFALEAASFKKYYAWLGVAVA
ncbi:hypothetical protein DL771_002170 [Monosporascus sp. 5C6A]|nr:hypothetical protein DL771_002170 [Monosporascus sp. 5C6A]